MRSTPEWIGRSNDSPIPDRVKERIAAKAGDCCAQCSRTVGGPLRAEFDHLIALAIGGQNREGNIRLLCHECHAAKTKLDVKLKAKAVRIRKRHLGIKKPRTITRWRRFDGSPVTAPRER